MESLAYYNGQILHRDEIKIPLSDRAVFFGDGIYDAAIAIKGRIMWEDDHIDRFFKNTERLSLTPCVSKNELKNILHEMVKKTKFETVFLYFQLSRKTVKRVHSAKDSNSSNLLVTTENFTLPDPTKKLSLITYPDKRYGYCNIKTLNLLPSVLAATEADKQGCDESVFIRNGIVTECSRSNIFIAQNGVLKTHPISERILPGIARKKVIEICKVLGIDVKETPFEEKDLFNADEILITSTTKLCIGARSVNGINIGNQKSRFAEAIYGELYKEIDGFSNI